MPEETQQPDPSPAPEAAPPASEDVNNLGEPSAPEPAGEDASAEPADEADEGEAQKPPEDERPKRRPSRRDRRIADLSRENAQLRAERELLAQASSRGQPAQPDAGDPMPTEDQFDDWGEFTRAQTAWITRQEVRKIDESRAHQQQEAAYRQMTAEVDSKWQASHEDALDRHADYEDIYDAVGTSIDGQQAMALKMASSPADVVYYLGKNPKELSKFRTLQGQDLLVAVGRYEERIEAQRQQRQSRAPAPVQPVRGQNTPPPNALTDNLPMSEWIKRRNKQVRG